MSQTPAYPYDDILFRKQFVQFAEAVSYPACFIEMYYEEAGEYIANSNFGPLAKCGGTRLALNLMTAHLLAVGASINAGQSSAPVVQATIDKISVTTQQFTYPNQWQFWLGSTEYGKQLLALLQARSVGGFYVPGGAGRAGFTR